MELDDLLAKEGFFFGGGGTCDSLPNRTGRKCLLFPYQTQVKEPEK